MLFIDERGKTDSSGNLSYFKSSTPAVQQSVSNRFSQERGDALSAL